jgi:hypothetical protein
MDEQIVETATGLGYVEIVEGTGARPKPGDSVSVHYTGWLKSGKSKRECCRPAERTTLEGERVIGAQAPCHPAHAFPGVEPAVEELKPGLSRRDTKGSRGRREG